MQKPKYWIYNLNTKSGREVFYNTDFFKPMDTEIFVNGVFPTSDGETYFIKHETGWDGRWFLVVYEWKADQEKRKSILQPKQILMGLAKNVELPFRIKNKILSEYGELENANS
jgi:hypothetical protein